MLIHKMSWKRYCIHPDKSHKGYYVINNLVGESGGPFGNTVLHLLKKPFTKGQPCNIRSYFTCSENTVKFPPSKEVIVICRLRYRQLKGLQYYKEPAMEM